MQRHAILSVAAVLVGLLTTLSVPSRAASAAPPWQDNGVGISDEVLSPWTPVTAKGDTVGVWGRTYRFGVLPLPASVVARDAEMLANPISLVGTAGGKPLVWSGAACRLRESRPHLARLRPRPNRTPCGAKGRSASSTMGWCAAI